MKGSEQELAAVVVAWLEAMGGWFRVVLVKAKQKNNR